MREIKFRVWDKEDLRMIVHEQDFIPLKVTSIGVLRLNPHYEESLWSLMPLERFELMQYTGLNDKNGKDIYEGDVVQYQDNDCQSYLGTIEFNREIASFVLVEEFGGWDSIEIALDGIVIGNIYENPELLTP